MQLFQTLLSLQSVRTANLYCFACWNTIFFRPSPDLTEPGFSALQVTLIIRVYIYCLKYVLWLVTHDMNSNSLWILIVHCVVNSSSDSLAGNKLKTLPESFGDLSLLRWLDVRNNPLSAAIIKEAGDCLDDKQCKLCAQRVGELVTCSWKSCAIC